MKRKIEKHKLIFKEPFGVEMQLEEAVSLQNKTPLLYSKDFYKWPEAWMGFDEDILIGENIIKGFIPFIENLAAEGLSRKTIKSHMDNLWFLGSEIIRAVHFDEDQRKLSSKELLLEHVSELGGPYVHQWDPKDITDRNNIKSYDSTCRKLHKFILPKK